MNVVKRLGVFII